MLGTSSILMVGGGWPHPVKDGVIDEVYCFDFNKGVWTTKTCTAADAVVGLPKTRRSHTCTKVGQYAYLIGGIADEPIDSEILWRLDLTNWTWKRLDANWAKPSHFHTTVVTPERYLVTFGGVEGSSNFGGRKDRHITVSVFTPLSALPTLKERCLQLLATTRDCSRKSLQAF